MDCKHPSLQVNEHGICCDCGRTPLYWNYAMQVRCGAHKTGMGWQPVTSATAPGNILKCDKCGATPQEG